MSKTLVIGTIAIILLVFTLGGFLLWQGVIVNGSLREQRDELKEDLEELRGEQSSLEMIRNELQEDQDVHTAVVEDLRVEREEFERLASLMISGTTGDISDLPDKQRSIRVIAPNGGENLCLDEEFEIRWEGFNIERVQITLKKGGFGLRIADYYPNTGSFVWKVSRSVRGALEESSEGYFLSITSFDGGFALFDESDKSFFITRCQG